MDQATLEVIASYAEIIGAGTIITGVIFGLYQIRLARLEQHNSVASQLMQTFLNSELARALRLLMWLPDGVSAEDLRAKGEAYEEAAIIVTTSFETMGLLVRQHIADEGLTLDLAGGIVNTMWRKLENWQLTVREELDQPTWAEWFEWLATISKEKKHTQV